MKALKVILIVVAAMLAICLCAAALFALWGYNLYTEALGGETLAQMAARARALPGYTGLESMPKTYVDAVVAVEDRRFYSHGGVDVIAIGRALLHDISTLSFEQGGSTITQQLAKNQYFTQEKRPERKTAEVFMAFEMEKTFTKEEILELYLNTIYFGDGYHGIGQASEGYFGKAPADLSDNECTLLAGIPNAPSAYAPSTNPELARRRQEKVLDSMVELGTLTRARADEILAQPVATVAARPTALAA